MEGKVDTASMLRASGARQVELEELVDDAPAAEFSFEPVKAAVQRAAFVLCGYPEVEVPGPELRGVREGRLDDSVDRGDAPAELARADVLRVKRHRCHEQQHSADEFVLEMGGHELDRVR